MIGIQTADAFEVFCQKIHQMHQVDCKFFIGSPATSYAAMLLSIKNNPNKPMMMNDPNMGGFFQDMICGGQAYVCTRYCHASPGYQIIYLDSANLHGYMMTQRLPMHDFQWMQLDELQASVNDSVAYIRRILDQSECYALMGDFFMPRNIHHTTWDFPVHGVSRRSGFPIYNVN